MSSSLEKYVEKASSTGNPFGADELQAVIDGTKPMTWCTVPVGVFLGVEEDPEWSAMLERAALADLVLVQYPMLTRGGEIGAAMAILVRRTETWRLQTFFWLEQQAGAGVWSHYLEEVQSRVLGYPSVAISAHVASLADQQETFGTITMVAILTAPQLRAVELLGFRAMPVEVWSECEFVAFHWTCRLRHDAMQLGTVVRVAVDWRGMEKVRKSCVHVHVPTTVRFSDSEAVGLNRAIVGHIRVLTNEGWQ